MSVECKSAVEADPQSGGHLRVVDVREWLNALPEGATLQQITTDFGNQRDPDVRLTGLRASWSEQR